MHSADGAGGANKSLNSSFHKGNCFFLTVNNRLRIETEFFFGELERICILNGEKTSKKEFVRMDIL